MVEENFGTWGQHFCLTLGALRNSTPSPPPASPLILTPYTGRTTIIRVHDSVRVGFFGFILPLEASFLHHRRFYIRNIHLQTFDFIWHYFVRCCFFILAIQILFSAHENSLDKRREFLAPRCWQFCTEVLQSFIFFSHVYKHLVEWRQVSIAWSNFIIVRCLNLWWYFMVKSKDIKIFLGASTRSLLESFQQKTLAACRHCFAKASSALRSIPPYSGWMTSDQSE